MKKQSWITTLICIGWVWATTAPGEIIYTDVNPDVVLDQGEFHTFDLVDTSDTTDFDIHYVYNENWDIRMENFTPSGSAVGDPSGFSSDVYKLSYGVVIGSSTSYVPDVGAKILWSDNEGAPWNGDGSPGYAGFRVLSDTPGSYYYGWVRLAIDATTGQITIYEWAYENTLDTSIEAGEGGSPLPTNRIIVTSFHANGELSWTNDIPGVNYQIQWADSLAGPWHGSWYDHEMIDGGTSLSFTASVPMFYRVTTEEWDLSGDWNTYSYLAGTNMSDPIPITFHQNGNIITGMISGANAPFVGAVRGNTMAYCFQVSGIYGMSVGTRVDTNHIEGFRYAAGFYQRWRGVRQ